MKFSKLKIDLLLVKGNCEASGNRDGSRKNKNCDDSEEDEYSLKEEEKGMINANSNKNFPI